MASSGTIDDLIRKNLAGSTDFVSTARLEETILKAGGIDKFGYFHLQKALLCRSSFLEFRVRSPSWLYRYKENRPPLNYLLFDELERERAGVDFISADLLSKKIGDYGGIRAFGFKGLEEALKSRQFLTVHKDKGTGALFFKLADSFSSLDTLIQGQLRGKQNFITACLLNEDVERRGGIQVFGYEKLADALFSRPYLAVKMDQKISSPTKSLTFFFEGGIPAASPSLAPSKEKNAQKWRKRQARNWDSDRIDRREGTRPSFPNRQFVVKLERYGLPPEFLRLHREGESLFWIQCRAKELFVRGFPSFSSSLSITDPTFLSAQANLLHIEELERTIEMNSYDQDGIQAEQTAVRGEQLFRFTIPGLAEGRPSVLKGDRVSADLLTRENHKHTGFVWWVNSENILVNFHESFSSSHCDLHFHLKRTPFQLMHRALQRSTDIFDRFSNTQGQEPRKKGFPKKKYLKTTCNLEQKKGIEEIVCAEGGGRPIIIFGPPGTGKTTTLVEALLHLLACPENRILVCAPSNNAVDLIIQEIVRNWPFKTEKKEAIFRMNGFMRDPRNVPEDVQKVTHRDNTGYQLLPLHAMKKMRIVGSTCMSAGMLTSMGIGNNHFTHIIMDEAGQSLLPESLVPLSLANSKTTIVLAGDPNQLGPIICSPVGKSFGLDISLLEQYTRLSQSPPSSSSQSPPSLFDPKCLSSARIFCLTQHYRSHPDIMGLYSRLFYENNLICRTSSKVSEKMVEWEGLKKKGCPILFRHVEGKEEREEDSPSWFNQKEVDTVVELLKKLVGEKEGLGWEDVGIICPYRKQVDKVRGEIKKAFSLDKKTSRKREIDVATTECFQGREKKVIIISCVRSSREYIVHDKKFRLGFLSSPKRLNVAISRAQSLLIIVGNGELLCSDPLWRNFLIQLEKMGVYDGGFSPSSSGEDGDMGREGEEEKRDIVGEQIVASRLEI